MAKDKEATQEQETVNGKMIIKATGKVGEGDSAERVEGSIQYEVGENLQEATGKFGEDLVFDLFKRALSVKAQAAIRREIENGSHPDDLQQILGSWDPAQTHTVRKDPKSSILKDFASLSEEEKMEVLESLRG